MSKQHRPAPTARRIRSCPTSIQISRVGRLIVLSLTAFETVFQHILGRLPEREKEKRGDGQEKKYVHVNT